MESILDMILLTNLFHIYKQLPEKKSTVYFSLDVRSDQWTR